MNIQVTADLGLSHRGRRRRIAVVGSGISGLSAAWLLSPRHDVTVYEKESRTGGHSNTVTLAGPGGPIGVDTGFIVYNEANYPNLAALFDHLDIATKPSDMSFAVSLDNGGFEYSSFNIDSLLGQRTNIVRPRFWRMVRDIVRFYSEARNLSGSQESEQLSLGSFLDKRGYSSAFIDDHILPMCAAIWSTTPTMIRRLPLESFVRFFANHDLLNLGTRPQWRTVAGGSRQYVAKLEAAIGNGVITANGARRIKRHKFGVTIEDERGDRQLYDHVIIATHADQALRLLDDPSADEKALLGAFGYTDNLAILHSDCELMPRRKRVWSSWNFICDERRSKDRTLCVTYWMNRLQGFASRDPLFVTLNPVREPDRRTVYATFNYSHPQFDQAALRAQRELWTLQGARNTWFCGSYFGYGFHEDGLQAGLAVAEEIGGIRRPWHVEDESGRIPIPSTTLEAAE